MKKLLLTLLVLIAAFAGYSQATYYWVGGTSATSFTANSNWNTALNGGGTTRIAAAATDILIFDGTNVGGTAPATGTVNATVTATNCGQLKLQNGASVNLTRAATGSAVLTVNGDATTGDDFIVPAGCTVTIGGPLASYDVSVALASTATALLSGTINLSPISTTVHTRAYITSATANSVVFASGSVCNISDSTATSGFNGSVANGITFKSGSTLNYYTGRSPIGSSSTVQISNFEVGSNLNIKNSNVSYIDGTTVYASSSWGNQKLLANLSIQNGATYTSDGPYHKIENLTIDAGSTLILHTSGNTPILGNLTVNGTLSAPAASTNIIVMGGNTPQTISGSGTINIPSFTVANYSNVTLSKSLSVINTANIVGKIDFGAANQITGAGTFTARVAGSSTAVTGNTTAGSYLVTGVTGTLTSVVGLAVTGTGVDVNSNVVSFSATNATFNLSKPALTTTTGSAFTFFSDTATMVTANPNGMDSLTGSVIVVGTKNYQSGTNYIINGATTKPFGISSGSTNTSINAGFVEVNAPITVNRWINAFNHVTVNGKITLRPLDTVHIMPGAYINGTFNASNYIATIANTSTGAQSIVEYDGLASSATIPVGSATNYLPATLSPSSTSTITVAVFEGITSQGTVNGTALTPAQKQSVVDAVWNINRLSGTGTSGLQLGWVTALEGSTFTTLANTDIGIIYNTGSSYSLPIGTGNNTTNIASATISNFGAYAVGAVPSTQPFTFNAIPTKTYGAADFNGGATSLNTTQPIVYTSSNPAVATIVGGNIHITGAGTSDITASQASDGFYPAASVTRTLTVNKASLTITAQNKTKFFGEAVPTLTFTYSAFAYSETPSVLLTPVVISTTATQTSTVGTYPITVSGATAANYTITFVNATLTIQAQQSQTITFATPVTKTYGAADFAIGATSTNTTIPLTYVSSNPAVATINGSNIHIVGAGTSNITVSQAGNVGYTPAADVTRVLTVNKANLTIKVRDTLKTQGEVNPPFTITYTGFVLGETATNLLTQVTVSTLATATSAPGYYPLTLGGATSNNYNIIYTNGTLTILPLTGTGTQYINAFMSNSSTLTVRVYTPAPKLGDITVYNMLGQPLLRKNLFMPVGFISTTIDASRLSSGIYIVTIKGDGVDLQKIIPIIK